MAVFRVSSVQSPGLTGEAFEAAVPRNSAESGPQVSAKNSPASSNAPRTPQVVARFSSGVGAEQNPHLLAENRRRWAHRLHLKTRTVMIAHSEYSQAYHARVADVKSDNGRARLRRALDRAHATGVTRLQGAQRYSSRHASEGRADILLTGMTAARPIDLP